MYEAPSSKIILKRIGITLGVILGIIAMAWGVVVLLKAVASQPTAQEPSGGRVLKPAEVIEAFAKEGTIQALNSQDFTTQISQGPADVIYKPASSDFSVVTSTNTQTLFYGKTPQVTDVSREVAEQTTVFLESGGYKKIENTGSARSENPIYTTLETSLSVCQLSSSKPSANSSVPPYHKLACADKAAIQAEYEAMTPLLTLFKESGQAAPVYNEISRTGKTEGNKSFAILNLFGETSTTSLLFAAIDNKWAYIGNLSGNEGSQTNGKYALGEELRRAISDPMYGDFLTKNVQ